MMMSSALLLLAAVFVVAHSEVVKVPVPGGFLYKGLPACADGTCRGDLDLPATKVARSRPVATRSELPEIAEEKNDHVLRSFVTYLDPTSFLGAVVSPRTDTYNDLSYGPYGPSLVRNIPPYQYTAISFSGNVFAGITNGDVVLTTEFDRTALVFNIDTNQAVYGVGCYVFPTDVNGNFLTNQPLRVAFVSGSDGTNTETIAQSVTNFVGFVSSTPITQFAVQSNIGGVFATVNDCIFATALPLQAE